MTHTIQQTSRFTAAHRMVQRYDLNTSVPATCASDVRRKGACRCALVHRTPADAFTQLARTQLAGTRCDLTLRRLARLTRLTRISIGSARVTRTSLCTTCSCWPRSGWCRWHDSNCSSRITIASNKASSPTCHARADPVNGQKEQKQGMQRSARIMACSV